MINYTNSQLSLLNEIRENSVDIFLGLTIHIKEDGQIKIFYNNQHIEEDNPASQFVKQRLAEIHKEKARLNRVFLSPSQKLNYLTRVR